MLLATVCRAHWLRFLADGDTCLPCELKDRPLGTRLRSQQSPSVPHGRPSTLGSDGAAPPPFQLRPVGSRAPPYPHRVGLPPSACTLLIPWRKCSQFLSLQAGLSVLHGDVYVCACEGILCCMNGSVYTRAQMYLQPLHLSPPPQARLGPAHSSILWPSRESTNEPRPRWIHHWL